VRWPSLKGQCYEIFLLWKQLLVPLDIRISNFSNFFQGVIRIQIDSLVYSPLESHDSPV
jgi:hypothetical protein